MNSQVMSRRSLLSGMAGVAGLAGLAALSGSSIALADEAAEDEASEEETTEEAAEETTEESSTSSSESEESPIAGYSQWAIEGGNAGNTLATFFLTGEEYRPTDEELTTMFQAANSYFQCHGLTGVHFVIVKDPDEQANILGDMLFGNDATGTVTVLCFADGLADQDIHEETYYPGEQTDNPEYWQMPYALVELGWALGYLNTSVREHGYRMHTYGALSLPNATTGEVDLYSTAGSFDYINRGMWDADKYLVDQETGESFTHYCYVLDREINCLGNLTLVCACLIGSIEEDQTEDASTDAETETDTEAAETEEAAVVVATEDEEVEDTEEEAAEEEADEETDDEDSTATFLTGDEDVSSLLDGVSGATAESEYKDNIRNNFDFWD